MHARCYGGSRVGHKLSECSVGGVTPTEALTCSLASAQRVLAETAKRWLYHDPEPDFSAFVKAQ